MGILNQVDFKLEVEGRFKLVKHKVDADGNIIPGTEVVAADWFKNLVTNNGLDFIGTASTDYLGACQVGTGSTTPSNTDTALQSRVAGSSTINSEVYGTNNTVSPYYGWRRKTYRFVAGTLNNVNVSELGIAPTTTGPVFSRALVLDGGGSPTTITVLVDEVLDVIYEFRLYVPMSDVAGSITLATEGSTHSYNIRALDVHAAQNTPWDFELGQFFNINSNGANWQTATAETNTQPAITQTYPSGQSTSFPTLTRSTYANGNYYIDYQLFYDLNFGNFTTGIGLICIAGSFGSFSIAFAQKIMKTATKKLTLNLRISWARH